MRITFPRLPDHARGYSVVERDDGVVYQMAECTRVGASLPHDLRHLIVERELGIADGIWGGIAAGTVFTSMRHLRGRRPPRSAQRSERLKRSHDGRLLRTGLLADLVEAIALLDAPSAAEIRRLTRHKLAVLPAVEPAADPAAAAPPPEALLAAAQALNVEAARWARLRPGDKLVYEWRLPAPAEIRTLRSVPRQRREDGRRDPRGLGPHGPR